MKKTRFTLGLITVVLAGVLLLSGCVTIRSETVIKSDGSGSRNIIMAIDKSMMALAEQSNAGSGTPTPTDPFADVKSSVSKIPGATVEKYSDASGREGVKITVPFKSLDELKSQQLGENGQAMDAISYTEEGSVVSLNIVVNTNSVASGASSATGGASPSSTPSAAEQEMAKQMLASMGIEFSYAVAVPGKILDWAPKNNATYNADSNEILWTLDLTSDAQPDIMVKWDNSQKPTPIEAPAAPAAPASAAPIIPAIPGLTTEATNVGLETVKKYAEAQTSGDQAAYTALFPEGKVLTHPLQEKYPQIFGASDLKVTYSTMIADAQGGTAQWTAEWTANGKPQTLTGIDVLTYDTNGKITAIQSFVDPGQFVALEGVK